MKRRYEILTYIITLIACAAMTAVTEYGIMLYIAERW